MVISTYHAIGVVLGLGTSVTPSSEQRLRGANARGQPPGLLTPLHDSGGLPKTFGLTCNISQDLIIKSWIEWLIKCFILFFFVFNLFLFWYTICFQGSCFGWGWKHVMQNCIYTAFLKFLPNNSYSKQLTYSEIKRNRPTTWFQVEVETNIFWRPTRDHTRY